MLSLLKVCILNVLDMACSPEETINPAWCSGLVSVCQPVSDKLETYTWMVMNLFPEGCNRKCFCLA